jgi:hypothetical protein
MARPIEFLDGPVRLGVVATVAEASFAWNRDPARRSMAYQICSCGFIRS